MAPHTSGRLVPYVALPTTVPFTSTFTLPIAVPTTATLSSAQPDTVTTPLTVEFAAGVSIQTVGATLFTRTVTVADPTSVYPSLSTAVTVMVCWPALSACVLMASEYPTLGHPGRPGMAPHTSGRLMP